MKKIKYLLFIIPFLFIFIGNINAYDIMTCGDTVITEQTFLTDLSSVYNDIDLSVYSNIFCSKPKSNNDLTCILTDLDMSTQIAFNQNQVSNSRYIFNVNNTYPYHYYYQISYRYNTCAINGNINRLNNSIFNIFYGYPYVNNSVFFYSNFNSSVIDSNVGNDLYTYNVLSLLPPEPEPEEPVIEDKIYLPDELEDGNCPIILNQNTIRVYEEEPQVNVSVDYVDYFINSHYIKQNGSEILSSSVNCLDLDNFTTSYVYRFDFHHIIIIFLSIVIIIGYPLMKIIHSFFIGFKRR